MAKQRRKTALMGKLLALVRSQFDHVSTGDGPQAHAITAANCLMCGLAIFVLKFPSLLKFDKTRIDPVLQGNLKRLFGVVCAPSDTTAFGRDRFDAGALRLADAVWLAAPPSTSGAVSAGGRRVAAGD